MDQTEINAIGAYPIYQIHSKERLEQGGVIENFDMYSIENINGDTVPKRIKFQYVVVISQACDIEQCLNSENGNNYLPNIMVLPMHIYELFKNGEHLNGTYGMKQRNNFGKTDINHITCNQNPRYHFLKKDNKHIKHDLIMDFKHYFTQPKDLLMEQYKTKYIATVNVLCRELLSQRFCNYLGRIGLPTP